MNNHLKTVVDCITEANRKGALADTNGVLLGFSGEALVGTLQRLANRTLTNDSCYLEIGVYQGLTLLSSAASSPTNTFFGIDNFAFFDPKGENKQLIVERAEKLKISNAHLINMDYEDALENLQQHIGDKKVSVYFIDGPHDYRSQLMCLLLIKPFLADQAVIIIDDSNYRHVRQANRDFLLTNPEFKLLYQSYTKAHPLNMNDADKSEVVKGWWNGVNIIYRDVNNELDPFFPETIRDRSLYENDHSLHSSQFPELIYFLWKITSVTKTFPLLRILKKTKKEFRGKYRWGNTFSENLLLNDFNRSIEK
jgi:hypothetical protein